MLYLWRCSQAVRQRSARPYPRVRIRAPPPKKITVMIDRAVIAVFLFPNQLKREQYSCKINGTCHGDAGKEGGHHDNLRGQIFIIVKFYGVKDGIDCRGSGSDDENRLRSDGRKRMARKSPDLNQKPCAGRPHDEADKTGKPCIGIAERNLRLMNLYAQCHHDNRHQSGSGILQNRPYKSRIDIPAQVFDDECGSQCINNRHAGDDHESVMGR